MKQLWDGLQAIGFVILVGAILFAIPIIGLLLGIAATVAFIYMAIKEN